MPYKNSHYERHRQLPPTRFIRDSFRTVPLSHTDYSGKKFDKEGAKAIVGKLKDSGKWKIQSILIPKKKYVEKELARGGYIETTTMKQIVRKLAKKYNVSEEEILKAIKNGARHELEHGETIEFIKNNPHVSEKRAAELIAIDHIKENGLKYYDILEKAEKRMEQGGIADKTPEVSKDGSKGGLIYGKTDKNGGKGILAEVYPINYFVIVGGGEIAIPPQVVNDLKIYHFKNKTNIEVIDYLMVKHGCRSVIKDIKARNDNEKSDGEPLKIPAGSVIINEDAVNDKTRRDFYGTAKEILNQINTSTGGSPILSKGGILKKSIKSKEFVSDENKGIKKIEDMQKKISLIKKLKKYLTGEKRLNIGKRINLLNKIIKFKLKNYAEGGVLNKSIEIEKFNAYNERRYSRPWIAIFDHKKMSFDFNEKVGYFTGDYKGGEGILYLLNPKVYQVYGYGQKDYRRNRSFTVYFYIDEQGNINKFERKDVVEVIKKLEKLKSDVKKEPEKTDVGIEEIKEQEMKQEIKEKIEEEREQQSEKEEVKQDENKFEVKSEEKIEEKSEINKEKYKTLLENEIERKRKLELLQIELSLSMQKQVEKMEYGGYAIRKKRTFYSVEYKGGEKALLTPDELIYIFSKLSIEETGEKIVSLQEALDFGKKMGIKVSLVLVD